MNNSCSSHCSVGAHIKSQTSLQPGSQQTGHCFQKPVATWNPVHLYKRVTFVHIQAPQWPLIDRLIEEKWLKFSTRKAINAPNRSLLRAHQVLTGRLGTGWWPWLGSWLRNTELRDRLLFTFRERLPCSSGCSLHAHPWRGLRKGLRAGAPGTPSGNVPAPAWWITSPNKARNKSWRPHPEGSSTEPGLGHGPAVEQEMWNSGTERSELPLWPWGIVGGDKRGNRRGRMRWGRRNLSISPGNAEGVSEDSGRGSLRSYPLPHTWGCQSPGASATQQVQEVGAGSKLSRAALYTAVVWFRSDNPARAQKRVPWTNVPPWTAVATCSWSSHAGPFPFFAQIQQHVPTCKSWCLHPWYRDKSGTDPTGLYNFFAL